MTSSGVQVDPAIGLDAAAVAARVADGRVNAYRADASRSAWSIVRANVFTLFNAIVFACFGILFVIGRWQDALFGSRRSATPSSARSRSSVPSERWIVSRS